MATGYGHKKNDAKSGWMHCQDAPDIYNVGRVTPDRGQPFRVAEAEIAMIVKPATEAVIRRHCIGREAIFVPELPRALESRR